MYFIITFDISDRLIEFGFVMMCKTEVVGMMKLVVAYTFLPKKCYLFDKF